MLFRALYGTGDWTFGNGVASYAADEQAIELNTATRLRSWKNDCFFDLDAGVDWVARLDKGQKNNLINELTGVLLQTEGVMKVNSVSVSEDGATRSLVITYSIDTIYSQSFIRSVAQAAGAVSAGS